MDMQRALQARRGWICVGGHAGDTWPLHSE